MIIGFIVGFGVLVANRPEGNTIIGLIVALAVAVGAMAGAAVTCTTCMVVVLAAVGCAAGETILDLPLITGLAEDVALGDAVGLAVIVASGDGVGLGLNWDSLYSPKTNKPTATTPAPKPAIERLVIYK